MVKVTNEQLVDAYNNASNKSFPSISEYLLKTHAISIDASSIGKRIRKLRVEGVLPLEAGVKVESGTVLTGVSRYHKLEDGGIWVKSDVEKTKQIERIKQGIAEFYAEHNSRYEIIPSPNIVDSDLLTLYPLPDMHWGLLTHGEELQHGENFDLKIQEQWVIGAMQYLVDTSKPSEKCVIADLGDLLHSMDDKKQTKSGHSLDVDGRTHKIVKMMFSAFTRLVDMALTKHKTVEIYSVAGNHSDMAGLYLKAHLSAWYRNEPRVNVVECEKAQQYLQFGKCILGFTHGHELKPNNAGEVLVADNMDIVSETQHRYFHFGHFHHDQKDKTHTLCEVEIHCNNLPRDKWSDSQGFRGKIGEAKAITYHKEYGEVSRNRFNINMIKDK